MVVATGFFDGVHLGHRFVLGQLSEAARARGDEAMVVTFWPHPRNVLQNDARDFRLLTCMEEKKALLEEAGIGRVEVITFTREFSRLTAEQYIQEYLMDRFSAKAILLGYDNRIGSDRCTPEQTAAIAGRLGLDVIVARKYLDAGGGVISSTRIRSSLASGDISAANSMLGYGYHLRGVVVAGNRIGRTIGFPTANMRQYEPLKMVPGSGVYLVRVETLGKKFAGMCNIGVRPTLGQGNALTIETNIFGFDEDIYGLDIDITFVAKIRDEKRFSGLDALAAQLGRDRERCLSLQGTF